VPTSNDELLELYCTKGGSAFPASCLVAVESAASLVGAVFSLPDAAVTATATATNGSPTAISEALDNITMCMDDCLMSVVSRAVLQALPEEERARFDGFDSVVDEEAAGKLVE
jgi:hypothetical protein